MSGMDGQAATSHRCATCGWPIHVDRVDVTTVSDLPRRRYMWGRWEQCQGCGSTAEPKLVVDEEAWLRG